MKLNKPFKIKLKKINDKRGFLSELYNKKKIKFNFQHSIISQSKKNVIRGLHFRKKPENKILYVIKGSIIDFCINLKNKRIYKFKINEGEGIFIPPKFAHGYECKGKENLIIYYLSWPYNKSLQSGIIWNDKDLNIKWTIKKPIISNKDLKLKTFKQIAKSIKKI
tara:strand:+ start:136 stop:630 length:495 start_codon:yes stop_codon:yes gene_type:complete